MPADSTHHVVLVWYPFPDVSAAKAFDLEPHPGASCGQRQDPFADKVCGISDGSLDVLALERR